MQNGSLLLFWQHSVQIKVVKLKYIIVLKIVIDKLIKYK